jgi:hypothetical protein
MILVLLINALTLLSNNIFINICYTIIVEPLITDTAGEFLSVIRGVR